MVRKRGRWLTILLVGEMLTATALGFFQDDLIPVLALILPLIISSGGNSGSQASTHRLPSNTPAGDGAGPR